MVHASYTCDGDLYRVEMITDTSMIDADMATVGDVIDDIDPEVYRDNMVASVYQDMAYCIYKNDVRIGFVYNRVERYRYFGASIWMKDTIGMIIAMKTMFEVCDNHKIEIVPHEGCIIDYISMASGTSIRTYHCGTRDAIVFLRDELVPKGEKLFKYFGIQNG